MARKQFRGVIAFDFDVDQENYKMFGALETALEKHMALFAERLADGAMDGEFELSKHVSVENPQSHFRDRRGPTGPIDMMTFRGGRGENAKLSKAQIERLTEMGKRVKLGMGLSHEERKRYLMLRQKAEKQGMMVDAPSLTSENMKPSLAVQNATVEVGGVSGKGKTAGSRSRSGITTKTFTLDLRTFSKTEWARKIDPERLQRLTEMLQNISIKSDKVHWTTVKKSPKWRSVINELKENGLDEEDQKRLLEEIPAYNELSA